MTPTIGEIFLLFGIAAFLAAAFGAGGRVNWVNVGYALVGAWALFAF